MQSKRLELERVAKIQIATELVKLGAGWMGTPNITALEINTQLIKFMTKLI